MHRFIATVAVLMLAVGTVAVAEDNALGLSFSESEFTIESVTTIITPGFARMAYIVLTNAT